MTTTGVAADTAETVAQSGPWRTRLAAAVVSAPELLPVLVLALGVVSVIALFFDAFVPALVVPAALAVAALAVAAGPRLHLVRPDRRTVLATLVALTAAAAWVALNVPFVSEYVVVTRDPGFLTLEALWLDDHASAEIPVGGAGYVDDAVDDAAAESGAFARYGDLLYVQGNKMLPAVLATAGWVSGEFSVLAANLVLGAVGLLAVYAAARRLVGPWWSLVPMVSLAVSVPYLTFSRAPYTEPMTMAFTAGGIAVGVAALRTGRLSAFAITGALLGGAATARIDGALVVIAMIVALATRCAATVDDATRRAARNHFFLALVPALALTALGYVDVRQQSPTYLAQHTEQVYGILALTAAAAVVGTTLVVLPNLHRLREWARDHGRALGHVAAVVTLTGVAVMASRPLWLVSRDIDPLSPVVVAVSNLQMAAGLPVDPLRSYDEYSVSWLSWYFGWHAVVLAAVGLALALRRSIQRRDAASLFFVTIVGVASAYYLLKVSITPDQIWAMRRLIPVAVPGMLLAATWALAHLAHGSTVRRAVSAVLAASLMVFPVAAWDGLVTHVEHRGRYSQASALCDGLEQRGLERVIWIHSSPFRYLPTVRVLCDVEVVEFLEAPTGDELQAVADAWGEGDIAVVSFDLELVPWASTPSTPLDHRTTATLGRPLTERPRSLEFSDTSVWAGVLQPDGSVIPLDEAGSVNAP